MRSKVLLVAMLVACGGKSAGPQQPVSNATDPTMNTSTVAPAAPPAPGVDASACGQRAGKFGPIPLTEAQIAMRRGTGAKTLADVATTKEKPIEVCMPPGQRAWIDSVTCTDGSAPKSADRAGSFGPGGTCGSVIDMYEVVCPEKTYEVFMDMYMCPAN